MARHAAPRPADEADRPWWSLSPQDVCSKLETPFELSPHPGGPEPHEATVRGLTAEEADRRRAIHGPNTLPRPKLPSILTLYVRQFRSPLIYLLIAAAALSVVIGETVDAVFIFAVLQINAVIGTVQEWRAATGAEALDKLVRNYAVVWRNGLPTRVDSADLVPGDIVELESGVLVPADIRLLKSHDLRVDEALLTGESLPVEKSVAAVEPATSIADRRDMAHAGTMVESGRATGIVVATATETEIGRIARALAAAEPTPPPLVQRLNRFSRAVGLLVVAAVVLIAAVLAVKGAPASEIFLLAVALAVSAVPEGLPVAITVALAIGTARMARRGVIVRLLAAVEGLGACTMIASDKTGTLTRNSLTITRLWLPGTGDVVLRDRPPDGPPTGEVNESIPGVIVPDEAAEAATALARTGALANEAHLEHKPDGWHGFGDSVDLAFLKLAVGLGLSHGDLTETHATIATIPYEPSRRYGASLNHAPGGPVLSVKGAAETVLPLCGGIDPAVAQAEADRLAADGFRVLAVAAGRFDGPLDPDRLPDDLTLLGFVGLIDPVRPEVPDAVERCRRAGVSVAMVTGDHPITAMAIARDLNIAVTGSRVLTGRDIGGSDDTDDPRDAAIPGTAVFARVEPMQKLRIVRALERDGHFVAVTGDGANDAPALRAAHIGVAMGRGGTDVARGAADLVLTDDNFASIVAGIEEGRVAYDNVRKVIWLLLGTGAAEIVLFFLALATDLPLPLFAVQLLWLNLVTNGIQDVALAFEKGEPDVLDRPPRPSKQPIFDRRMIEQVLLSGAFIGVVGFGFFAWALDSGWDEASARNALLLLMVLFENAMAFNCRSERRSLLRLPLSANPLLIGAVVAAQTIHIGAMYVPGLNTVLGMAPVGFDLWLDVAILAFGLVVVVEAYKRLRR